MHSCFGRTIRTIRTMRDKCPGCPANPDIYPDILPGQDCAPLRARACPVRCVVSGSKKRDFAKCIAQRKIGA